MTHLLLVQEYLKSHSLAELKLEHGVNHRVHNHKMSLNYDMIEAVDSNPLAKQCRGLILGFSNSYVDPNKSPFGETVILARPFDRFFNYGQDAAASINFEAKDTRFYEKLDGCFLYNTKLNCWDGTTVKIGDVVKKGLNPTLIGMDKNGNLVPCKITNRFDHGKKDHWVDLYLDCPTLNSTGQGGKQNKLRVTVNHEIWSDTQQKFTCAGSILPGEKVLHYLETPDDKVMALIRASLLGDGSLCGSSISVSYQECHSVKQKNYINWKYEFLGECKTKLPIRPVTTGYGFSALTIKSKQYKSLLRLRDEWYPHGKKIVPQDLSWLNDFSVAVWYMDDGSLAHNEDQKDRALFATNGFTENDVKKLAEHLEKLYQVNCTVYFSKGWNLRINSGKNNEIDKFWGAIAPYIHPSMEYKLPQLFRNKPKNSIIGHVGIEEKHGKPIVVKSVKKVTDLSKKEFPLGRRGFDIETTTNNYMCKGILVHNSCIIYYYDGFIDQWCIATRGMPEANLGVDDFAEYTFTTLFQKAILETTGLDYKSWQESLSFVLNRNITYVFELTTPLNQIVVRYMNFGVHLIGMRDRVAGNELEIEKWGTELKVPLCPSYQLSNLTDMMKFVAERNALKHEGIVVCDANFKRVKIKNADYVAYGRIRDQIASTPRALVQVILDEKLDDIWSVLSPNVQEIAVKYQTGLRKLIHDFDMQYKSVIEEVDKMGVMSDKVRQKQVAVQIQHHKYWLAPMMQIYAGKYKDLRDYFSHQKSVNGEYKKTLLNFLADMFE